MITLVTLLLLGIGFRVHLWAGWVAKIQFLPAFLAFSSVVVVIFMTTLFLGRIGQNPVFACLPRLQLCCGGYIYDHSLFGENLL